ncbi:MAG: YraN family protein, partial [Candidatus Tectomicrobia bacterium]|nr:YraN family protein [Candidatus Tectomicrobia bacterium]
EDLGALLASVDQRKQHRITRVAVAYVQEHQVRNTELRFDVVAVTCPPNRPPEVAHVPAAFDASPHYLY